MNKKQNSSSEQNQKKVPVSSTEAIVRHCPDCDNPILVEQFVKRGQEFVYAYCSNSMALCKRAKSIDVPKNNRLAREKAIEEFLNHNRYIAA